MLYVAYNPHITEISISKVIILWASLKPLSGETQRVAVARAIAHNPKMLLADEPTANLDTATGQQIVQLMRDLGRTHGCTIIMATHDMEIAETADLVTCLKDGRILEVKQ